MDKKTATANYPIRKLSARTKFSVRAEKGWRVRFWIKMKGPANDSFENLTKKKPLLK
jgi:hypothetical protein